MPDLTDLETLVRATRPAPDPAWAARLDGRAAAGFHRDPWWTVLRTDYFPALAVASVLTVLVVIAVAWPGGGSSTNSSSSSGGSSGSSSAPAIRDSAGSAAAPKSAAPTLAAPEDAGTGNRPA